VDCVSLGVGADLKKFVMIGMIQEKIPLRMTPR